MGHVHTVKCPECGRAWTGEFDGTPPDEAVCRDCLADKPEWKKVHKDVHINPKKP